MKKIKPEEQPNYEFKPDEYESPGMQRMQRELTLRALELLELKKGNVLDIGCGSGLSTEVLIEMGFEAQGIDPNEQMVATATARGLDCVVGKFEDIPMDDEQFDAVVSISALQWVEDYKTAAAEVWRVLRPRGRAVIQFYPKDENDALRAAKAFAWRGFEAKLAIDNPTNPRKRKVFLILQK